jgi:phospholipase C
VKRLVSAIAAAGLATLLGPAGLIPAGAAAGHGESTPIQHLVVMTQDQHSFDNYLGTHEGADGIPAGVCVPVRTRAAKPCIAPYTIKSTSARLQLRATAASEQLAVHGGRMDGFVWAQASRASDGRLAMGHYSTEDVPGLAGLAERGVLFDRWFGSLPGGSISNRLFQVTARPIADQVQVPENGWPQIPTIFDELTAAGVSWRVYVENYEPALNVRNASDRALRGGQVARVPLLAMPRDLDDPSVMRHVVDLSQYYRDIAADRLPAVTYVVSTASSEHAPAAPARGQRLIRAVANALIASDEWSSSAMILNYDSSGGWYDHVRPPTIAGRPLGLRVPAALISPYTAAGSVDHTTYDSAAVLKFIEQNWSLPALTTQDRNAADLRKLFRFSAVQQATSLIGPGAGRPPVKQPHRAILYVGYGLALSIGVLVLIWVLPGRVRPRLLSVVSR